MPSVKCRPFYLCLNMLKQQYDTYMALSGTNNNLLLVTLELIQMTFQSDEKLSP